MQESLGYPPVPTIAATTTLKLHFPEQERLTCPRCESTNTKFCYFNNYNLSQPRHFCKSCKRYWTKGGSLRNIPIGGTPRKPNKKRNPAKKPDSTTQDLDQPKPDQLRSEERGGTGLVDESDLRLEHVDALVTTTRFL